MLLNSVKSLDEKHAIATAYAKKIKLEAEYERRKGTNIDINVEPYHYIHIIFDDGRKLFLSGHEADTIFNDAPENVPLEDYVLSIARGLL